MENYHDIFVCVDFANAQFSELLVQIGISNASYVMQFSRKVNYKRCANTMHSPNWMKRNNDNKKQVANGKEVIIYEAAYIMHFMNILYVCYVIYSVSEQRTRFQFGYNWAGGKEIRLLKRSWRDVIKKFE